MYTGPTDGLTRWFTSLGYHYDPSDHGMASDWALDLVSLGFVKPQQGTRPVNNEPQVIKLPLGSERACERRCLNPSCMHVMSRPQRARLIGKYLKRYKGVY
jgi:hypothetical protein